MSSLLSLSAHSDALDRLARLACRALGVPSAVITVIEADRQRFIGLAGLNPEWTAARGTPLDHSLCQVVASTGAPLIVLDTRLAVHIPSAANVVDEGVVAYAGVPLRSLEGQVMGAFAAIDHVPRDWTESEIATLWDLAAAAAAEIGLGEMNRQLTQARSFSDAVVNTLPRPLVVVDHGLTIVAANSAFTREFGLAGPDLVRRGLAEIGGGLWAIPALTGALRGALASRRTVEQLEIRPEHPTLRGQTFHVNVRPLDWREADGPMLLVTFQDVTTTLRNQRERETFIDTLAHDLRNPVAAIRGEAQLMERRARRDALDAERIARGLAVIEDGSVRMIRLIDDMVDTVYLNAGQQLRLQVEDVDLGGLVRVGAARTPVTMRQELVVEIAGDIRVRADPARLRRILDNLLGNAVKYSPAGGTIRVRVDPGEHDGRPGGMLSVSDEGIGIPAEDLPRLFDRFHRGRNVGMIEGNGLGLSGVRQLVEQHGGVIAVASELGAGTTVSVWLPAIGAGMAPAD